jgi:S1-C subfamily serine protease
MQILEIDRADVKSGLGRGSRACPLRAKPDSCTAANDVGQPRLFRSAGSRRRAREERGAIVQPRNLGLRTRYKIKDTVKGVVIIGVDTNSRAAGNGLSPGDVIVGIAQYAVEGYADLDDNINKLKQDGRNPVPLAVAAPNGVVRFVMLNIQ